MYGLPADKYFATSPHIPLAWQRKLSRRCSSSPAPTRSGTGCPSRTTSSSRPIPTQSVELPLRLGVRRRGAEAGRRLARRVDGALRRRDLVDFDVIVYATGYNITFPFFDVMFNQRTGQPDPAVQADVQARVDRLAFMGFAQAVPTLFPFVECQARLLAAYAAGHYRLARATRWSG
jgi:hypothetical protein